MKRISILGLMACLTFLPGTVWGATLGLLDTSGDPNQVDVFTGVGGSFDIVVRITPGANENIAGLGFLLNSVDGIPFTITNRVRNTTIDANGGAPGAALYANDGNFTDAQVTAAADAIAPAGPDNALNLNNDRDLGTTGDGTTALSVAADLMTLTITYPALPEGDYHITIFGGTPSAGVFPAFWANADTFEDTQFSSLGTPYTVHVPEPTSLALLVLGAISLVRSRRRQSA
jgi:hypothetical protein